MTDDQPEASESYKFIHAIVDCGELRWEYKVSGSTVQGSMQHDEPVDDYSEEDIRNLTVSMLDVPEEEKGIIEVLYR